MPERNVIINLVVIFIMILGLGFYITTLKVSIHKLEKEINSLNTELLHRALESERLAAALKRQNEKVMLIKSDRENALSKLRKWKNKPPDVRYKTIIRYREVKSNECKDIKNILDDINVTDFNSL